eukprot:TRINITY_DN2472_c0_g1_i1.p1 TRINITY_DN2472_c0_g1~~TRINITY_DN2472_c0_g1_i1.p1  ORF type:complete len:215 (-),score=57.46 TRINITY_DN2472_c0_g1_i1:138-782(-)
MLDLKKKLITNNDEVASQPLVKEALSKKRKAKRDSPLGIEDLWEEYETLSSSLVPYETSTIDKWNQKTLLTSNLTSKRFKALNQSLLQQISKVLEDRDRLIKRTQVNRAGVAIFGQEGKVESSEELFDDTDFYQSLLKEFVDTNIETSGETMGKYFLETKKLRDKANKRPHKLKSKGRKLPLEPMDKLVNFMSPTVLTPLPPMAETLFTRLLAN